MLPLNEEINIGLLDIDICELGIQMMMDIEEQEIHLNNDGFLFMLNLIWQ